MQGNLTKENVSANLPTESLSNAKFTPPLHKLQTPSNRITGLLSVSNTSLAIASQSNSSNETDSDDPPALEKIGHVRSLVYNTLGEKTFSESEHLCLNFVLKQNAFTLRDKTFSRKATAAILIVSFVIITLKESDYWMISGYRTVRLE